MWPLATPGMWAGPARSQELSGPAEELGWRQEGPSPELSPLSSSSDSVSYLPWPFGPLLFCVPRWGSKPPAGISCLGGNEVEQRERPHYQNAQVQPSGFGVDTWP